MEGRQPCSDLGPLWPGSLQPLTSTQVSGELGCRAASATASYVPAFRSKPDLPSWSVLYELPAAALTSHRKLSGFTQVHHLVWRVEAEMHQRLWKKLPAVFSFKRCPHSFPVSLSLLPGLCPVLLSLTLVSCKDTGMHLPPRQTQAARTKPFVPVPCTRPQTEGLWPRPGSISEQLISCLCLRGSCGVCPDSCSNPVVDGAPSGLSVNPCSPETFGK